MGLLVFRASDCNGGEKMYFLEQKFVVTVPDSVRKNLTDDEIETVVRAINGDPLLSSMLEYVRVRLETLVPGEWQASVTIERD